MHNTFSRFATGMLLLVCPILSLAQVGHVNKAMHLGVKANVQAVGIANQNNYGQNEMDYGLHPGVGAGAVFTYDLNAKQSILLEASFQTGGQEYEDGFKSRNFRKEIRYNMISVPVMFRYILSDASTGYSGVRTFPKPIWYILGGIQVDRFRSPEIRWYLDGNETDFLSFVLEGGNPNQAILEELGPPDSDADFFVEWDATFVGAAGCKLYFAPTLYLSAELRGGIGITDMNARPWRLRNNDGIYGASRNAFLGLHAGIHVHLSRS